MIRGSQWRPSSSGRDEQAQGCVLPRSGSVQGPEPENLKESIIYWYHKFRKNLGMRDC